MTFKLFTIPCVLLVVITLFLTACEKEGPAGPTGPAGAQGPAGPTGATGAQGPAGTANVYYSDWMDLTFAPQIQDGDTSAWTTQITAPRIVDSILAKGEIRVYLNIGTAATPSVVPLPLDALAFGIIVTPIYQVGKIVLLASEDAGSFTNTNNQKSWQYRYIIIPGGTPAGTQAGGIIKKVNWNNYEEVKTYLKLKN